MKKGLIYLVSLLMIFSLFGCKAQEPQETVEKPLDVYCVKPEVGTLERYTSIVGKTIPQTSSDVVTEITEKVTKVYKKVGDHVKKGELLMELDAEDINKELETSKADYELSKANVEKMVGSTIDSAVDNAQSNYERLKNSIKVMEANLDVVETKSRNLSSQIRRLDSQITDIEDQIKNATSSGSDPKDLQGKLDNLIEQKEKLETARDQLDKSYDNMLETYEDNSKNLEDQKNLGEDILKVTENQMKNEMEKIANAILTVSEITYNNALKKLDDTKVYSPIDGYVDFCNVKENNTVPSGSVAFTISERKNTLIEFSVSGIHVPSLAVGNKITVTNRDEEFTATITEIPPMIDTSTGLFKITASVDNKDQSFVFGANHFVQIPTEHTNNAMMVPISCVYFEDENVYVYVAKDGTAIKTNVETGIYNDKFIEIKSGLTPTDDVITSWSSKLIDAAKINIRKPEENSTKDNAVNTAQNPQSTEGEE